jgi:Domain of unknown function (DUF1905)/Bacteriocin-protection, YdeI or OmpD-Associated
VVFYFKKMATFTATLEKFGMRGEKTGWIYLPVPADIALAIKPNNKKSFKVKGSIENIKITGVELTAMVEGFFIIAVSASLRKQLQKKEGDEVQVSLEEDDDVEKLSPDLLKAIEATPAATYFNALPPSHKNAYSVWIKAAKSKPVIAKRVAAAVKACTLKMSYGDMMKAEKMRKEK